MSFLEIPPPTEELCVVTRYKVVNGGQVISSVWAQVGITMGPVDCMPP